MDANEIKKLLSEGHTDEAIDQLIVYGKSQSAISNIISNISAEFHRLKGSYIAGVISEEEYSKGLNKINFRILSLIEQKKGTIIFSVAQNSKLIIYSSLLLLFIVVGVVMLSKNGESDVIVQEKIATYKESIYIVTNLSSYTKGSNEYLNQKTELDKLLDGRLNIVEDDSLRQMLLEYYYYLEQYERDSDITKPFIQKKSNEISEYGFRKIKNFQK